MWLWFRKEKVMFASDIIGSKCCRLPLFAMNGSAEEQSPQDFSGWFIFRLGLNSYCIYTWWGRVSHIIAVWNETNKKRSPSTAHTIPQIQITSQFSNLEKILIWQNSILGLYVNNFFMHQWPHRVIECSISSNSSFLQQSPHQYYPFGRPAALFPPS